MTGYKNQKQPPEVFYKKSVLDNFEKFTGNTSARASFLINLQACIFIKRTGSGTGVCKLFLVNFAKFQITSFFFTESIRETGSAEEVTLLFNPF